MVFRPLTSPSRKSYFLEQVLVVTLTAEAVLPHTVEQNNCSTMRSNLGGHLEGVKTLGLVATSSAASVSVFASSAFDLARYERRPRERPQVNMDRRSIVSRSVLRRPELSQALRVG